MKLNKQQRAELKHKFGGHCAYCGELLGDKWHADHIEAVKRDLIHVGGGKLITGEMTKPQNDTIENMNPACVPCNTNKSSMPLEGGERCFLIIEMFSYCVIAHMPAIYFALV